MVGTYTNPTHHISSTFVLIPTQVWWASNIHGNPPFAIDIAIHASKIDSELELELWWWFTHLWFCGELRNCLHKDYARLLVIFKNLQDGPCGCHLFLLSFSSPVSVPRISALSYSFIHDTTREYLLIAACPTQKTKTIQPLSLTTSNPNPQIHGNRLLPWLMNVGLMWSLSWTDMAKLVVQNGHQIDTLIVFRWHQTMCESVIF